MLSPAPSVTPQNLQWDGFPILDHNLESSCTDWDICYQDFRSPRYKEGNCHFGGLVSKYQCRDVTRKLMDLSGLKPWQNKNEYLVVEFKIKL